ncbi:helix-turn-helix transcriptional regulator [Aquibacillus sediminis]|uniref:helix-turn-helix transcriptional regulator n=1 Tax=Aquibacillus sediminis TaxID=2574734 RepID=UPI0011084813|nr:response regulator transcription factor [Aquibacillus sediminis]
MKIVVVKKPSLLREGIVRILQEELNHTIETLSPNKLEKLRNEYGAADLIIMDIDTDMEIMTTVDYLKNQNKNIIVWTSDKNHTNLCDLFELRLSGYFYNGMGQDEFVTAVQSVLDGETYIHHSLSPILLDHFSPVDQPIEPVGIFSSREWEVLELLTKGFKNSQIADTLFISERTVKNYVSLIMKKMNVQDRTNIVLTALKNKWIII